MKHPLRRTRNLASKFRKIKRELRREFRRACKVCMRDPETAYAPKYLNDIIAFY